MKNKGLVLLNIVIAIGLQVTAMINSLIVPRLIISVFGSEVNGLIASINQFLNYITLLEGGVGAVTVAALYKPLAANDVFHIKKIVNSTVAFFRKLGIAFLAYTCVLMFVYPRVIDTNFTSGYVASLIVILSLGLSIQYLFAVSMRLLLIADQRSYVCNLTSIGIYVLNIAVSIICFQWLPNIHLIKLFSALIYFLYPLVFSCYVRKHYPLPAIKDVDASALSNRWSGFGHNLAHFVHTNTDIILLTLFAPLSDVSVYSVYYSVIVGIKGFALTVSAGFSSFIGHEYVSDDNDRFNASFQSYEAVMFFVVKLLFICCAVLITPFVILYTKGIGDANYSQPIFGILMTCAEAVYCLRDPYLQLINNAGHFKQTLKYSVAEAVLNVVLSIIFLNKIGLIGIAIGTLMSMLFRYVVSVAYAAKTLIKFEKKVFAKRMISALLSVLVFVVLVACTNISIENEIGAWVLSAIVVFLINMVSVGIFTFLFEKQEFMGCIKACLKRVK